MVDCGGTENFTIASHRGRWKKGDRTARWWQISCHFHLCANLLPGDAHRDAHGRRPPSSEWKEAY